MQIFTRIKNPDQNPIHKSRKEKKKSWAMKTHTHTKKKKHPNYKTLPSSLSFEKSASGTCKLGSLHEFLCVCVCERERERDLQKARRVVLKNVKRGCM